MTSTENTTAPLTSQIGGDHYLRLGEFQPIIVMSRWLSPEEFMGYAKGTALAYLGRDKENSREDIQKAIHTLQLYLELSES